MHETAICTDGAVCASVDECASVRQLLSFLNVSRFRRLIALLAMRYDVLMIFGAVGWNKCGKKAKFAQH